MTGISNGRLGMMLLVGTETILFSSFIGAYIILRAAAVAWPPMGVPHLTLGLSVFNTAVLLLSSCVLIVSRIRHSGESRNPELWTPASAGVTACFFLGALFLAFQAVEFHRLYARGLTLQTGAYGALFYTLITCHGLHVLGGLVILAIAMQKANWAENAEIYWHFVTGVWLVLFSVLYLV